MTKNAEKMIDIMVTATFEVTYRRAVTMSQFKKLEQETIEIADVVDESEPYRLASCEGECEMDWDVAGPNPKSKKTKRKTVKRKVKS